MKSGIHIFFIFGEVFFEKEQNLYENEEQNKYSKQYEKQEEKEKQDEE